MFHMTQTRKRRFRRLCACLLAATLLFLYPAAVRAGGPEYSHIRIAPDSARPLQGARRVGINIEMSLLSDEMRNANGGWVGQTLHSAELDMMRWGYDAWAFDWEGEVPLCESRYWGGLNSRDAEGCFGLREFIQFCSEESIIPLVMIPIESLECFGGTASLERVMELAASMARYIADQGIELCYFEMGNEPWNNGAKSLKDAERLGALFPRFHALIKEVNPDYRLVLQRAPENILWKRWNRRLIAATQGDFDAYDDHRYSFFGWNKYFDYDKDSLLSPGTVLEGKEAILGECNIGWTPWPGNWQAGHVHDLGGSMAVLNAILDQIQDGRYQHIVSWPSCYPGKASIEGCPEHSFGWFDLDDWYLNARTSRYTGPAAIHRIVNQNVLPQQLTAESDSRKLRCFAYCDEMGKDLRLILINKWDETTAQIDLPRFYTNVNAMVLTGESVWDEQPEWKSLFHGPEEFDGTAFEIKIPAEAITVLRFSLDESRRPPEAPQLDTPAEEGTAVGTAPCFGWMPAEGADGYQLIVSEYEDLSDPVIDTATGLACRYQASGELKTGTDYYWCVRTVNRCGRSASEVRHFCS